MFVKTRVQYCQVQDANEHVFQDALRDRDLQRELLLYGRCAHNREPGCALDRQNDSEFERFNPQVGNAYLVTSRQYYSDAERIPREIRSGERWKIVQSMLMYRTGANIFWKKAKSLW